MTLLGHHNVTVMSLGHYILMSLCNDIITLHHDVLTSLHEVMRSCHHTDLS